MVAAAKERIDWDAMESDWRAGIKSVLQLSKEYSVSRAAILKHWDKLGIARDLAAKIEAMADALVTQDAVTQEVTQTGRVTERAIIEANAELQANIIRSHRSDVTRSRNLTMALLEELEAQTNGKELYEQLGELLHAPDDKGVDKLNELYRKVISLPGRTDTLKKLADSMKIFIGLEREAFNIDGNRTPGQTLDDFLDAIANH